jgi:hypothetical protein
VNDERQAKEAGEVEECNEITERREVHCYSCFCFCLIIIATQLWTGEAVNNPAALLSALFTASKRYVIAAINHGNAVAMRRGATVPTVNSSALGNLTPGIDAYKAC